VGIRGRRGTRKQGSNYQLSTTNYPLPITTLY
jgi:hypothetical protein